jgi:hypothetical protein
MTQAAFDTAFRGPYTLADYIGDAVDLLGALQLDPVTGHYPAHFPPARE